MHQRYQTSYTALFNGVVRHGAQFWGLRVYVDHTHKSNRKTNALTSFVRPQCFTHMFVFMLIPQYMHLTHTLAKQRY